MTEPYVIYVLLRFPRLTETFIAEEMRNMEANGANLRIYALLPDREPFIHPVSQQLLPRVRYAPSQASASLWLAQAYYLFKTPTRYLALLWMLLRQPAPRWSFLAKRLDVFLKGVWMAKELEHTPVSLMHAHFGWLSAAAAVIASRLLDLPFTFTAHAYDIYSEKNDLLRMACSSADRIITISESNRAAILAVNPALDPAKVVVVHCGIDLGCFRPPVSRPASRTLHITSVGRLLSKKGHEFLIRACGELQAQRVPFQCVIVGSGDLEASLRLLIRELCLENQVTLAGAQPQEWIRDRLAKSDIFVLACVTDEAGDRDGIPVSIMEAMAMHVPVISTNVSGIPELVRNEETGLLVPQRDPCHLAAAMLRLAKDEPLRQKLAGKALELVSRDYDSLKNTGQLWRVFEECVRVKNRRAESPA